MLVECSLYSSVYWMSVLYCNVRKTKLCRRYLWGCFWQRLITIFNPLIMEPLLDKIGWKDRYIRFYWILPVGFLCSFCD